MLWERRGRSGGNVGVCIYPRLYENHVSRERIPLAKYLSGAWPGVVIVDVLAALEASVHTTRLGKSIVQCEN
jgi:hypothetical protein